ncbi:MAG: bifunctional adenosylcobinamide kinase/adenosylcobinamide-phosphate guanylyltransferase [Faecousia sp.]
MKLIIGGAYQGKRDFAKAAFHLTDAHIFTCSGEAIDFSAPCIDKIEEFTLACVNAGKNPVEVFQNNKPLWENSVLICQDIFCGVVPIDATMRQWRQETGRLCQYLAKHADSVSRIFCGLEQKLK